MSEQTYGMRLKPDQPNPFPAKLIYYGWDKTEGATVVYLIEYIRTQQDGTGLASIPPPPRPDKDVELPYGVGLVEINVSFRGSVALIRYIYRSIKETGRPAEYGMRAFTAETPIFKHREFPMMYLWYATGIRRGKVEWAHLDPGEPKVKKMTVDGVEKRVFESCPDSDSENKNPMRGIQDFLEGRVEVSETHEYANRSQIPADVISRVGERERPPFMGVVATGEVDGVLNWINSNLSIFGPGKWIRSGAKIQSTGSGYRVTKMWMLNNTDLKSKWAPEIYTNRRLTSRVQEEE